MYVYAAYIEAIQLRTKREVTDKELSSLSLSSSSSLPLLHTHSLSHSVFDNVIVCFSILTNGITERERERRM
jgi:hypothetical protein